MNEHLKVQFEEYRKEVRDLWLKTIPAMVVVCVVVFYGITWVMTQLIFTQPLEIDWRIIAACFSVATIIPPIMMLYPERPTEESVAHDQVLNAIGSQLSSKQK